MSDTAIDDVETVTVENRAKWLFSQLGQLVIAVGLISLVFNYAYRYLVDWSVSSPLFYVTTIVLALIVFIAIRREYLFVNEFRFGNTEFSVHTAFGVTRTYKLSEYKWVPALHKVINVPEKKANLSFYVNNIKTGKNIRNYSWAGFSSEDFKSVSMKYGYSGATDFEQKDFGKA